MQINWYHSWKEIEQSDCLENWKKLYAEAEIGNVFLSTELVKIWLGAHVHYKKKLYVLHLIIENNELFWPLVFISQPWHYARQKLLRPIGYDMYDYLGPLIRNSETRNQIWTIALLEIQKHIPFDEFEIKGLTEKLEGAHQEHETCPYIDFPEGCKSGEEYLNYARKSIREDIRRQIKHCSKYGALRFRHCTLAEAMSHSKQFNAEHKLRWGYEYNSIFFNKLLEGGIENGCVVFGVLNLNEIPIAWHLGFMSSTTFFYYKPVVNHEYMKLSPGKLLLYYLIDNALKSDKCRFDLLRGMENYKTHLATDIRTVYQLKLFGKGAGSYVRNFYADTMQHIFRSILFRIKHFFK